MGRIYICPKESYIKAVHFLMSQMQVFHVSVCLMRSKTDCTSWPIPFGKQLAKFILTWRMPPNNIMAGVRKCLHF